MAADQPAVAVKGTDNLDVFNAVNALQTVIVDRVHELEVSMLERMVRIETGLDGFSRRQEGIENKIDRIQEDQTRHTAEVSAAKERMAKLSERNDIQDEQLRGLRDEIKAIKDSNEKMRESYDKQLQEIRKQVFYLVGGATVIGTVLGQLIPLILGALIQ